MKRNLLLMRHAKSDWSDSSLNDYSRALNRSGREAAPKMAEWIVDRKLRIDLILASSARRVEETVALLVTTLGAEVELRWDRELYLAPPYVIRQKIAAVEPEKQTLLVVGHNPGLETLVSEWCSMLIPFPTAAVAWFQCTSSNWDEVCEKEEIRLKEIGRPKEL